MGEMKMLTEEEFYNKFKLITNHFDNNASFNGDMFETYGDEFDFVYDMAKENRVITIIESDGDDYDEENDELRPIISYATGLHLVNRLGFLVLDKAYEYDFEVKID